jgi:2-keto-4-pentenoate hydratase
VTDTGADAGTAGELDTDALGRRLFEAYAAGEPVTPPSAAHDLSMADAYAVQRAALARRREAGAEPVGYKLGFTNETVQAQYGVDEPGSGRLLSDAILDGPVATADLVAPRVEPELAFVLDAPLAGPTAVHEVLAATRSVVPVVEVVDSRTEGEPTAADAVADNALAARLRTGAAAADPQATDWGFETVQLRVDGALQATGTGADVLGHPARAVAWLAERLGERDERIAAGALISTGSLTRAVPVEAGCVVTAEFGSLGSVGLRVE